LLPELAKVQIFSRQEKLWVNIAQFFPFQENVDIDFINWKLNLADIETRNVGTSTGASTVVKRDDDQMRSKQKNAPILDDVYMIKNDNGLPSVQLDYKLKRLAQSRLRCSSHQYKIAALDVPIDIFLRMSRCFHIYVLWTIIERQLYVWEEKQILLPAIQSTWWWWWSQPDGSRHGSIFIIR
jgi:hypothetical protein